jgi:HAD superfamily hydrolase (TIGR01509 family)
MSRHRSARHFRTGVPQEDFFFESEPVLGLLFDANGVLYHRPKPNRRLNAFLAPLGLAALPDDRVRPYIVEERDAARTGRLSLDEYFQAKLRVYGVVDPDLVERGVRVMMEDAADIALFNGTREAIHALSTSGYALGIVTDSTKSAEIKLSWLEAKGLPARVWTTVVSSAQAGFCKPAAEIYYEALDRMGIQPAHAAFVGHATDELEGAEEIGMATVAFRPDDPDFPADVHVEDLRELVDMLE